MKYEMFERTGMVALCENKKWSLFRYIHEQNGSEAKLAPLSFAQNVSSLEVHEDKNLVITPEKVFTLDGQVILEKPLSVKVIRAGRFTLIVSQRPSERYYLKLLIWNGYKVVSEFECTNYAYSNTYLAIQYDKIWSLYRTDGSVIDEGAFIADDVEICHNLLITKGLCAQSLYSLTEKKFLKENQLRIVCSKEIDLALCAKINEKCLNVYTEGKWHSLPYTDEFGFVDGVIGLFYVKYQGKYLLYEENATKFMKLLHPNGVDFIANNNGTLLIIDDGKPCFYNKSI